jgi:hypothetical protein
VRLPAEEFAALTRKLESAGIRLPHADDFERKLGELRVLYEPYVNALSARLLIPLPPWVRHGAAPDNWQTSAWERHMSGRVRLAVFGDAEDDHL